MSRMRGCGQGGQVTAHRRADEVGGFIGEEIPDDGELGGDGEVFEIVPREIGNVDFHAKGAKSLQKCLCFAGLGPGREAVQISDPHNLLILLEVKNIKKIK